MQLGDEEINLHYQPPDSKRQTEMPLARQIAGLLGDPGAARTDLGSENDPPAGTSLPVASAPR